MTGKRHNYRIPPGAIARPPIPQRSTLQEYSLEEIHQITLYVQAWQNRARRTVTQDKLNITRINAEFVAKALNDKSCAKTLNKILVSNGHSITELCTHTASELIERYGKSYYSSPLPPSIDIHRLTLREVCKRFVIPSNGTIRSMANLAGISDQTFVYYLRNFSWQEKRLDAAWLYITCHYAPYIRRQLWKTYPVPLRSIASDPGNTNAKEEITTMPHTMDRKRRLSQPSAAMTPNKKIQVETALSHPQRLPSPECTIVDYELFQTLFSTGRLRSLSSSEEDECTNEPSPNPESSIGFSF